MKKYIWKYTKLKTDARQINIILWNMNYILDSKEPNVGDKALLSSIIGAIKESILNAHIIVFARSPDVVSREFGVEGIKYHIMNVVNIVKAIYGCDYFVFAGGEVIVDRGSSLYTPFMLHSAFIAKLLKKPIIGYGIGVGEMDEISSLGKFLSGIIFNKSVISVRDTKSKETLEHICSPKKIYCTADPVINLKQARDEDIDIIFTNIGVNIDDATIIGIVPRQPLMPIKSFSDRILNVLPIKFREKLKITPPEYKNKLKIYKKKLAEIGDYLVQKYDAKVVLVPMCKGFMSYKDDILCKDIIKEMHNKSNAKLIDNNYSAKILKGIFGKMHLVIGIPLHSIIFASSMEVPVIAFSYESKVGRFMKILELEEFSFNIEDINDKIDLNKVYYKIDYIMNNRNNIKEKLKIKINYLKQLEENNIELFSSS